MIDIVLDLNQKGWKLTESVRVVTYNGNPALQIKAERKGERVKLFVKLGEIEQ